MGKTWLGLMVLVMVGCGDAATGPGDPGLSAANDGGNVLPEGDGGSSYAMDGGTDASTGTGVTADVGVGGPDDSGASTQRADGGADSGGASACSDIPACAGQTSCKRAVRGACDSCDWEGYECGERSGVLTSDGVDTECGAWPVAMTCDEAEAAAQARCCKTLLWSLHSRLDVPGAAALPGAADFRLYLYVQTGPGPGWQACDSPGADDPIASGHVGTDVFPITSNQCWSSASADPSIDRRVVMQVTGCGPTGGVACGGGGEEVQSAGATAKATDLSTFPTASEVSGHLPLELRRTVNAFTWDGDGLSADVLWELYGTP